MNRTVLKNQATGATEVIYEQRRTSIQFWIALVAQILAIAVVVFAAARFGMVAESKQVIEDEMTPPTGMIYMGVEKCVKEELEPIKEQVIIMDVRQQIMAEDVVEIKDTVKEMAKNGG